MHRASEGYATTDTSRVSIVTIDGDRVSPSIHESCIDGDDRDGVVA